MKFLEVKGYIKSSVLCIVLEKQIPVHHDRSVEEDVYGSIQNLSQFPEHHKNDVFTSLVCGTPDQ